MKCLFIFPFMFAAISGFTQADYILYNGKIFTSDKSHLWVTAVAIQGEKILEVGADKEVLKLKGNNTKLIDLAGRVVVPGFNDAHAHVGAIYPARRFEVTDNPIAPTPWSIVRDSISKIAAATEPGIFIITSISSDLLDSQNIRRKTLDSLAPRNPLMLSTASGHGKILNSLALQFFGLNEHSKFLGGRLDKDGNQKLSGLLEEYSCYQIGPMFAKKLDHKKIKEDLNSYYNRTASLGITSIQNMCTQLYASQALDIYSHELFNCRVRIMAFPFTNDKEILLNEWDHSFGSLNKMNYVSGVKLVLDGTPLERLACMRQPYSDQSNNFGRLNFSEAQLKQFMEFALKNNQQILIHTGGDSTYTTIIRVMRMLHPDDFWKDKRVRLEHGEFSVMTPEDINTLKSLGIIIVQNPTHLAIPDIVRARFGDARLKYYQAIRTLLDNNIPFAIGSDGPYNPFLNIMLASIHPNNPKEAMTREEAVIAYTYGAAYAEFKENEKGSLTKGKYADLAVLSQDIFSIGPDKLLETTSVMTFLGGKIIYSDNSVH